MTEPLPIKGPARLGLPEWGRLLTSNRRSRRTRGATLRDIASVLAVVFLAWAWLFIVTAGSHVDADAFRTFDASRPYALSQAGSGGAFLYSPVIVQLLTLVQAVPPSVFYGGLAAVSLTCLVYLLGLRWAAVVLLIPAAPLWQDLLTGNIHLILGAAIVMGFRHPAAWSFVLLTKVTPGVGLAWFAVRREWRQIGITLTVTGGLALASLVVAPQLWANWLAVLSSNLGTAPDGLHIGVPLVIRVLAALTLVVWGALTDRPWTVPAAAFVALPIIWIYDGFALLVAVAAMLIRSSERGHTPHAT